MIEMRRKLTTIFLNRIQETLNAKGNDYANNENPFSNFTNTSAVLGIPTEKVFLAEIVKKCSRITELLSKEAKCESVMDSVLDIAGYACLLDNYMRMKNVQGSIANEEESNQEPGHTLGQAGQGKGGV